MEEFLSLLYHMYVRDKNKKQSIRTEFYFLQLSEAERI